MSEMPEIYKEQYCKGGYSWCGRYMVFEALARELERTSSFRLVSKSPNGAKEIFTRDEGEKKEKEIVPGQ